MHIPFVYNEELKGGVFRAIHFVYLPTNQSCDYSHSEANVRGHLLRENFSRMCVGKSLSLYTVNPEIFMKILFLRIALKDIFAMCEIRD